MEKYKVAFIHNIIAPYRVPLFEHLSRHPSIELFVYFCANTHKNRRWGVLESNKYDYKVLQGVTLILFGYNYHVNPSIVSKLIKGKYDVVILSGNPDFTTHIAFLTCKLLKIPVIWWSEGIENSQSMAGKLINPITKYIVKNVNSIIVPGNLSLNFHVKMGAEFDKIFLAPNTIDNDLFIKNSSQIKKDKSEFKRSLNFDNKEVILYLGQLIEVKGVEYLIKAYNMLKQEHDEICLNIIREGVLKDKLEKMCIENNIKDVYFKGWVSEEMKYIYYSTSDLFVLPTLDDVWGLVINEAMCCGLPVISTKAAGASWDMIIPEENGYVVEPSNLDQLYLAMKNIMEDKFLRDKMGKKSLEIVKTKFNIANMINGFVSAIEYSLVNCK